MLKLSIYIFHDTRRRAKSGLYPVQMRVYSPITKTQKRISLGIELSEKDFIEAWTKSKPKAELAEIQLELKAFEAKALKVASNLMHPTIEAFEEAFFEKRLYGTDVNAYYETAISNYIKNEQLGTASNYKSSITSLCEYYGKTRIPFHIITSDWLKRYERYMLSEISCSSTTVGIYLRPLRNIFNTAIADKTISQDTYPFGKRKYIIPAPRSVKKALSKEQLKTLFEGEPLTLEQEKAKDFWFFSYMCNGMNIKDIALLKYNNLPNNETLVFRRAKTAKTNKSSLPVTVNLNSFAQTIIEKYGSKKSNDFIFSIISKEDNAEMVRTKTKNFTRYINQHFLKYAKSLEINEPISTYWARHSFATRVINSGASIELLGEMLSHSDIKTTQNYIAGFENDIKKAISNKLLEF